MAVHILNNLQPVVALAVTNARPVLPTWQLGQVLQALVLSPNDNGRAALEIGGTKLQAETNLPLRAGETLTVRVEKQGDQSLLRVIDRTRQTNEVQAQALRTALPRQAPLPPLLANLVHVSRQEVSQELKLPQNVEQAARELVRALPDVRQVSTADGLRKAIETAGTFFESHLAQSVRQVRPFPAQDLKGSLMRLIAHLGGLGSEARDAAPGAKSGVPGQAADPRSPVSTQARGPAAAAAQADPGNSAARTGPAPRPDLEPPIRGHSARPQPSAQPTLDTAMNARQVSSELRSQSEGGLARINLHQLGSIPTEDSPKPLFMVEVPVRNGDRTDVWGLRLEQDGASGDRYTGASRWSVSLAFELDGLGPMHARVTWHNDTVQANFWAETADAAARVSQGLADLRRNLVREGLQVGDLNAYQGAPPEPPRARRASGIVNIKA